MAISISVRDLFKLEDYDEIMDRFNTVEMRGSYLIEKGYTDKEIGIFLNKRPQHINHIRNRNVAGELHERRLKEWRKTHSNK